MRTWAPPPGMRQAVASPQWNLPFTACTFVSMDTVVVLASSLQGHPKIISTQTYSRALIWRTRHLYASGVNHGLCCAG